MVHKEFFQKWENQMNEVKKILLLLGNKKILPPPLDEH